MRRRKALLAPLLAPFVPHGAFAAGNADTALRLATAWRASGATAPDDGFRVGLISIDWAAGRVQIAAEVAVPSRAHGLLPLPDGGFLAVANRPGHWLLRCDADGALVQRLDTRSEVPQRSFNGHVEASADARWLYSSETDIDSGAGWISVRDARTLQRVAQFESAGIDPHQMRLARDGNLMVANGGIVRDALGRKIEPDRMSPSLVRIDPSSGRALGRWTLPDTQLSLRHMAWSGATQTLLGVALQAEHASLEQRAQAPALAVWDGQSLSLPCDDTSAGGYAGDIAAGPAGGFVISAQKQGRALWWQPGAPQRLNVIAQITEPCALLSTPDGAGAAISGARGAARWHATQAPRMLPWPQPLAPDNHWVQLAAV